MLTLRIIGKDGSVRAEYKGMDIKAVYEGELVEVDTRDGSYVGRVKA